MSGWDIARFYLPSVTTFWIAPPTYTVSNFNTVQKYNLCGIKTKHPQLGGDTFRIEGF